MIVPGFSQYVYKDSKITNTKTNKLVTITAYKNSSTSYVKLKNDEGVWKSIAVSKIHALCNPELCEPPADYVLVPGYYKTYINKSGSVWIGPGITKSTGSFGAPFVTKVGYIGITTEVIGPNNGRLIHQLLALAFLDPEYLEKGLCVMHLDNDKANYSLANLKVSTYSDNNKAAYEDGLNPGVMGW